MSPLRVGRGAYSPRLAWLIINERKFALHA
jgi:hypothetical protein